MRAWAHDPFRGGWIPVPGDGQPYWVFADTRPESRMSTRIEEVALSVNAMQIATHAQPRNIVRQEIPRGHFRQMRDTFVYCDADTMREVVAVAQIIQALAEMLYRCPSVQRHTFEGRRW